MKPEGWEIASVESGLVNANIRAGRLETEGIPVRLEYEAVAVLYGLTMDGLGRVNIMVPAESLELAREILSETYHEDDLDWQREEPPEK